MRNIKSCIFRDLANIIEVEITVEDSKINYDLYFKEACLSEKEITPANMDEIAEILRAAANTIRELQKNGDNQCTLTKK